jgi:hypothetical protein
MIFIAWLICSILVATAANARGRSAGAFLLMSLILSPVIAGAYLMMLPMKPRTVDTAGAAIDAYHAQQD